MSHHDPSHAPTPEAHAPAAQPQARAPGRPHVPPNIQGEDFDRVVETWQEARDRHDARHPPLLAAVATLARNARARGVGVGLVLRALNAVIDPRLGGDPGLVWDSVREHAGETAIASYYRDD